MARTRLRPVDAVDPLEEPVRRYLLTGDEEALDLVVRETRLRLLAAARRIGAPQDAEDSVQAAYLSLVRKRGEPLGAPVFPWLLTAAIRTAYRRKALARREEDLARRLARPPAGPSAFTLAAGREIEERIGRAVERLPAAYRDPVVLHYLAGLSSKETAGLLDLPEATVRTRLRRARILLRSRVPAGLLHGLFIVPWFLKDAAEGVGSSFGFAASGGLIMKAGGVAVVALGAAALGTLAGAKLLGGAPAGPAAPIPPVADTRAAAERESLQKAHDSAMKSLRAEKEAAETRAAEAEVKVAALAKEAEEAKAVATAPPAAEPAKKPSGPRFTFGEYDEALKELDWPKIGTNMKSMVPLLRDLMDRVNKGEKPDPKALGKIQQLNGPLVEAALTIGDRIPGTSVNAKFTHPVFTINAIAASLEAAGLPLSDTQGETLQKLGQEYADRDRSRLAGYDDGTWELQKVLEEADLRDRFYDAAFAVMEEAQRDALRPESTKGYLGLDIFSSGLVWGQHIVPVYAADKAGAVAAIQTQAVSFLKIPEEKRAAVQPYAAEWAEAAWQEGGGTFFGQPLMKASVIAACAKTQIAVMRKMTEDPALGADLAARARKIGGVVFPFQR